MSELKYKKGDKVRIKSLDWYNENKDINGNVHCGDKVFDNYMSVFCGSVVTIGGVYPYNAYDILEDMHCRAWTDEMIECKVEEETKPEPKFKVGDILFYRGETCGYLKVEEIREENGEIRYYETSRNLYLIENDPDVFADKVCSVETEKTKNNNDMEEKETLLGWVKESDNLRLVPHKDYEIKHDGDNFYLVKKKKEYPKTYEECLSVLGIYNGLPDVEIYNAKPSECKLFESLIRLKRCRDAYWHTYGEEFNWDNALYYIYTDEYGNVIESDDLKGRNCVLAFPDKASKDAFYDNFKSDIEFCKEFL